MEISEYAERYFDYAKQHLSGAQEFLTESPPNVVAADREITEAGLQLNYFWRELRDSDSG